MYVIFGYKTLVWEHEFRLKIREDLGGGEFDRTMEIKYLGLYIDEKLTWKKHSIVLQSKLRKLNYLFYYMRGFYSKYHLLKLYKPLYESVMSYGILHWGASHHISPLKVLQNRVCRTILNMPKRTSAIDIYAQMGVQNIDQLYKSGLLMFVFKNKELFKIHDTVAYIRTEGGPIAGNPKYRKHHSRIQARYQGFEVFHVFPFRQKGSLGKKR